MMGRQEKGKRRKIDPALPCGAQSAGQTVCPAPLAFHTPTDNKTGNVKGGAGVSFSQDEVLCDFNLFADN